MFATFYDGRDPVTTFTTGLDGTATYEGDAVGKYVERPRDLDAAELGIFRADVELTADFDNVTLPLLVTCTRSSEKTRSVAWRLERGLGLG